MTSIQRVRHGLIVAAVVICVAPEAQARQAQRGSAQRSASEGAASAPRELVEQASALLESGDVGAAQARIDEALLRYPSDAALRNVAGAIAAEQGSYAAAERHFRAAISADSRFEPAYVNLGRLYQEHAKEDPSAVRKALSIYAALLKVNPSNAEGLYQTGYLNACMGEWSSSRVALQRLPAESRSRPQTLVLLAADLAGSGQSSSALQTAATLVEHTDLTEMDVLAALPALERVKDDALLLRLFEALDARGLASSASLRQLGLAEGRLGHFDRSREALERAVQAERGPLSPLLLDLARVAYKQKDYQGALGYLAHARDVDPQNAEVHFFFGLACVELNLGSEAYESLKKAVALAPENPFVNYAMGAVAIHRHEPSEAIPYFEAYVRMKPDDPRGRFALGAARFYSNDLDGARADLREAVRTPVNAAGAHYFLGRIARQLNDLDAARVEIGLALKADPRYADALAELGLLQTRNGDYEGAERTLNEALAIDRDNYAATVNLAALFTRTRDPRREEQNARLAGLQQKRAVAGQEFLRIIEVVK
jgi:tetratricopeptide (TPR) repeat protein